MTKEEIKERLKQNRDWNHFHNDSPHWADAFLLYNAVHGLAGRDQLRMSCSKCFVTVKEWLES